MPSKRTIHVEASNTPPSASHTAPEQTHVPAPKKSSPRSPSLERPKTSHTVPFSTHLLGLHSSAPVSRVLSCLENVSQPSMYNSKLESIELVLKYGSFACNIHIWQDLPCSHHSYHPARQTRLDIPGMKKPLHGIPQAKDQKTHS
jgi:hypothetical protein